MPTCRHPWDALRLCLLLTVVPGLTGCGALDGGSPSPGRKELPVNKQPVHWITSEGLAEEYADNRQVANLKYRSRYLQVEGTVDQVTRSSRGQLSVILVGFSDPQAEPQVAKDINCFFVSEEQTRAAALSRGQKISVRGKCEGESTSFLIDVVDCELVTVGPDPSIAVTAEQLTREYAEDRAQADRSYREKQLLIEGVFLEMLEGDVRPLVVLAGHNEKASRPLRIQATCMANQKSALARLQPGQKITIKGECQGRSVDEITVASAVLVNR